MEEKFLFAIIGLLLLLIIFVIAMKNKKTKNVKGIGHNKLANKTATQKVKPTKSNYDNSTPNTAVEKKSEELKKPIGWVIAKSYDDDVRNTNVSKYVHEETIEIEELISNTQQEVIKKGTILVVDDSITVLKLISTILTKLNFETINKENGLTALDYLKMTPRFPDLIITDLEMPKMNGAELIKAIRSEHKFNNIPILIISANPNSQIHLFTEGLVNGVISKPFDKEDFIEQVQYLINNR